MRRRLDTLGQFDRVRLVHLIRVDADEMLANGYKRKAFLARYGRQSMLQWDEIETSEIERHIEALANLMREENELSKAVEDG